MGRGNGSQRFRSRSNSRDRVDRGRGGSNRTPPQRRRKKAISCSSSRDIFQEMEDKMTSCKSVDASLSPSRLMDRTLRTNSDPMSSQFWSSIGDGGESKFVECHRSNTYKSYSGLTKSQDGTKIDDDKRGRGQSLERKLGRDRSLGDRRGRANRLLLSKSCHELNFSLESPTPSQEEKLTGIVVSEVPPPPPMVTPPRGCLKSSGRKCRSTSNDAPRRTTRQKPKGDSGSRRIVLEKKPRQARDRSVGSVGAVRGRRCRSSTKRRGRRAAMEVADSNMRSSSSDDNRDVSEPSRTMWKRQPRSAGRIRLLQRKHSNSSENIKGTKKFRKQSTI